jgi:hypothetical protein
MLDASALFRDELNQASGPCVLPNAAAAYRHVFVLQHQYGSVATQRSKLPSADSPLYAEIHGNWSSRLEQAVAALPRFPGETGA